MKVLPVLYKRTSTGAIQQWRIGVEDATIITRYGQVDGKEQETKDLVTEGKNQGKANETSAAEQAEAEAQSKWTRQIKKGYVEDPERAARGETDIEGGFDVMLAHSFAKHGAKIKFPAYMQPKLDGIRCAAIVDEGVCTLWTRTKKPITSMPHIIEALEALAPSTGVHRFDGELYNHALKREFERLVSLIRQEEPPPGCEMVQYHIYDAVFPETFESRTQVIDTLAFTSPYLAKVGTQKVLDEASAIELFHTYVANGYEGGMIRSATGLYEGKRSYGLQKIKEFDDAEFAIVGVQEGRGKLSGCVGAFTCVTADQTRFDAKMMGDTEYLRKCFEDHSLWQGKRLTVKYQGLTNKNGVPRFPVGVRIREEE